MRVVTIRYGHKAASLSDILQQEATVAQDSPDEDWFPAEAEHRNRLAAGANGLRSFDTYGVGQAADGGHSRFGDKFLTGISGISEALADRTRVRNISPYP